MRDVDLALNVEQRLAVRLDQEKHITIAWNDPPGTVGSGGALVHGVSVEVFWTSKDGRPHLERRSLRVDNLARIECVKPDPARSARISLVFDAHLTGPSQLTTQWVSVVGGTSIDPATVPTANVSELVVGATRISYAGPGTAIEMPSGGGVSVAVVGKGLRPGVAVLRRLDEDAEDEVVIETGDGKRRAAVDAIQFESSKKETSIGLRVVVAPNAVTGDRLLDIVAEGGRFPIVLRITQGGSSGTGGPPIITGASPGVLTKGKREDVAVSGIDLGDGSTTRVELFKQREKGGLQRSAGIRRVTIAGDGLSAVVALDIPRRGMYVLRFSRLGVSSQVELIVE
jgi:hypothetical protein